LGALELLSFQRNQLQDVLDEKTQADLSFSTVDHLRWDTKQIFDMAVAEGPIARNPALLLFTPNEAAKPWAPHTSIRPCIRELNRPIVLLAPAGRRAKVALSGRRWAPCQGGAL